MECTAVGVSKQDFWAWKQKYSFLCYCIFTAFNNIFKKLNLFLNKYWAEIQLPGNGIWRMAALRTHRVQIFTRDETGLVYLPTQLERTL
jgi:hypothetical protein